MASAAKFAQLSFRKKIRAAFQNWYIYACGYRQLGLRREDILIDDHPDVQTAIKRLSPQERDLRYFRLKRSYDLTMKHTILPEEQWTKPEEDNTLYLIPYILHARQERLEKEQWDHK